MNLLGLTGSPHFDLWWWFVGVGLGVLLLGTLAWDVACLRLLLHGHRVQATLLSAAGTVLGPGQVAGALVLDLVQPHRMGQTVAVVLGWRVRRPDLLLLPDSAATWIVSGLAMLAIGVAMLAIRQPGPPDPEPGR